MDDATHERIKRQDWEAATAWRREQLERQGVRITEPMGRPRILRAGGDPALELGELRVSLEAVTFTPCEDLHPASMAYALEVCQRLLRRLPIGRWEGWHKGQDEHLADCYFATLVRILEDEPPPVGVDYSQAPLLDVDPVLAVLR